MPPFLWILVSATKSMGRDIACSCGGEMQKVFVIEFTLPVALFIGLRFWRSKVLPGFVVLDIAYSI